MRSCDTQRVARAALALAALDVGAGCDLSERCGGGIGTIMGAEHAAEKR